MILRQIIRKVLIMKSFSRVHMYGIFFRKTLKPFVKFYGKYFRKHVHMYGCTNLYSTIERQ